MGVGPSTEDGQAGSPEGLSYRLAERFAAKCFTPLELTHFKDNFFSRATDQDGVRYWNEKTLSDFLGIPDGDGDGDAGAGAPHCPLDAGPVVFRMVSYLGAFPFQNTLAPSVLTFEAMVKVVVLLTERYGKVLRRARKDRIRLLFGSLADVQRKDTWSPETHEDEDEAGEEDGGTASPPRSHAPGFLIDEPANDEYEDDDDDLALAALESLDAIEVFKHDSRIDKAVYEARVSITTLRRLVMLLLVISPLKPLESVKPYTSELSEQRMEDIRNEAETILAAFGQEPSGGISYRSFAQTVSTSLPYLFDPLTPLFEHLLFSKNLDLSQRRRRTDSTEPEPEPETEPVEEEVGEPGPTPSPSAPFSITLPGDFESAILSPTVVSHLSFFLPSTSADVNILRGNVRLHPVFSTAAHGSSLTSFSHNVLTWQSSTLLLLDGTLDTGKPITIGAYLPQPWKSSTSISKASETTTLPCLFQLSPTHTVLPGNSSPSVRNVPNAPAAYFSTETGLALGCQIPPASRSQKLPPTPHGAGSLTVDTSLETADLHISTIGSNGVFLPPPSSPSSSQDHTTSKTQINILNLEVWGVMPDPATASSEQGQSAIEKQRQKWDFEAREAERRRNLNLKAGAGDPARESARWLLETAGLVGGESRYL
ncbi:TLDc domain-containing protein 2 [Aspergillus campestris IBT 28561]|uniref:TLDc domain-containing protein 2 n=1 Tax=Aspergillus campestris (strain IBT 28561) TaxID=1392248 RepID=A0A2I1CWU2_ASPC2|nr:TLDc domain-containing protein 2 [Aspergillus campestris IBT 28561]PKY02091.1 TLDc domain-containing protein 2 [Aspergillus campestris IBT 28561]